MPGISNYVGGDIVSGLLLMDFYRKDEIGLFFDIGTNGELVIGTGSGCWREPEPRGLRWRAISAGMGSAPGREPLIRCASKAGTCPLPRSAERNR